MIRPLSRIVLAFAFFSALPLLAQKGEDNPVSAIQDNSFLLEEAYNQEDGVIQHISFFTRNNDSGDWLYTFTEEIPAGGQKHQLSCSIAVADIGDNGAGIGDVALNYRYQLIGDGTKTVAIAPRISVLLPSGSVQEERGVGGVGVQVNLPASFVLAPRIAAHTNVGATWIKSADNVEGDEANSGAYSVGQSVVYAVTNRVQFLVEGLYARVQSITGPGETEWESTSVISPAIRWAYNLPSGLQIVPGIGVPLGVGPSAGERSVLLYISLEHPAGGPSRR